MYICVYSAWGKELDRISKFGLFLIQLNRKFSQTTLDMFSITYPKIIRSENLLATELLFRGIIWPSWCWLVPFRPELFYWLYTPKHPLSQNVVPVIRMYFTGFLSPPWLETPALFCCKHFPTWLYSISFIVLTLCKNTSDKQTKKQALSLRNWPALLQNVAFFRAGVFTFLLNRFLLLNSFQVTNKCWLNDSTQNLGQVSYSITFSKYNYKHLLRSNVPRRVMRIASVLLCANVTVTIGRRLNRMYSRFQND